MIPEENKKRILKYYLRPFLQKVTQKELEDLKVKYPKLESCYVVGGAIYLRKVGLHFLLSFGRQTYQYKSTYEVIDAFLGNSDEEHKSFYEMSDPLLFLYHMKNTMTNKRLEEIVNHVVSYRRQEGKLTIVLAETKLSQVEASSGLKVYSYQGSEQTIGAL